MAFYFSKTLNQEDYAYPLETLKDIARTQQKNSFDAILAVREVGSEFFFCQEFFEPEMRGNCQGCDLYVARNGKNGICKHWSYTYHPDHEKITIIKLK